MFVVLAEMVISSPVPSGAVFRTSRGEDIVVRKNFPESFAWVELKTTPKSETEK